MPAINERQALKLAVEAAVKSPCSKSKRGVVTWDGGIGRDQPITGFNGPPAGFACDGTDACRKACGTRCVHAEIRVLMKGYASHTDLLHVKVRNGEAVPSGEPSCPHCAKAILDSPIKRVWLLHETGLRLYSAEDFYVQTLINCELPLIREPEAPASTETT